MDVEIPRVAHSGELDASAVSVWHWRSRESLESHWSPIHTERLKKLGSNVRKGMSHQWQQQQWWQKSKHELAKRLVLNPQARHEDKGAKREEIIFFSFYMDHHQKISCAFWVSLLISNNLTKKMSHRCVYEPVSLLSPDPVKLTPKMNHHRFTLWQPYNHSYSLMLCLISKMKIIKNNLRIRPKMIKLYEAKLQINHFPWG